MHRAHQVEEHLEGARGYGGLGGQTEGADVGVVPVGVVSMRGAMVSRQEPLGCGLGVRIGFGGEPAAHIGGLGRWIKQAAIEQARGDGLPRGCVEDGRRRIERAQPPHQDGKCGGVGFADEVGLGQHDAVGDRRLLDRLRMRLEGRGAVDGIDHRDDAVEPVAHDQIGMHHRGVQHRGRIGEAGGLDDHPGECGTAIVEIAGEPLQRLDEIAAQVQHRHPVDSSTTPSSTCSTSR